MKKVSIDLNAPRANQGESTGSFLEKLSFILCLAVPFLLPLFFIPSVSVPFHFSKMLLLSFVVLVILALWIIARLKDGRFVFFGGRLMLLGFAVVAISILSAFFSGAIKSALVGQVLNLGTAGSIAMLFLLLFLVPTILKSKYRILYSYLAFLFASLLIGGFEILRLIFGASLLSMGIFTDITSNMVGTWNDLGVLFGIGTILSLITLELVSLSKIFRILTYVMLIVSLFFLSIVNFSPVWYMVAFFSLVFLVYIISFSSSDTVDNSVGSESANVQHEGVLRKIPMMPFFTLILSLIFILGGATISSYISNKLNIVSVEARPSWTATFSVAKSALAKDPIFGAGPNRFAEQWLLYKPAGVNTTLFWNTDFNFGVGFLPTFLVTTGLLGAISWLVFLGYFLFIGFRALWTAPVGDKISRYLITSSFMVALFLWVISIFYTPSLTILVLTFFFTGISLSSIYQSGTATPKVISFIEDPRKGFISVLALILLLIGAVAIGYSFTRQFFASVNFQKGVISFNTDGNADKAEGYIVKAASLDSDPAYFRSLTQIDLMRLSNLMSQDGSKVSADALRSQFQEVFKIALGNAEQAVALDGSDYQNWFILGQVYDTVVPLKIQNSYESASSAYKKALTLYPTSPVILLSLARLEVANGDNAAAKNYIGQALQQKNNYTEAIFLLAQIQVGEGNLKDAISSVEAAAMLSPNDSGVFFQLGLLRYNNKDFQGAAGALEQSIILNPQYANAKYFLGLSYYQLDRNEDAIAQFKDLQTSNPDSKEVALILKNLMNEKNPFANATPPIDSTPEKRPTPPVTEKATTKSE